MTLVNIDDKSLKDGVLGLVVALVEIIKEALRLQALRRMDAGSLTEAEVERLGEALMDLDTAIHQIKMELGIAESVKAVRDGLDRAVNDVVDSILNPSKWEQAAVEGRSLLSTSPTSSRLSMESEFTLSIVYPSEAEGKGMSGAESIL